MFIIPVSLSGQDYNLFNATSKKLFTDYPDPLNTYSLSIESSQLTGADSIYYNFFKVAADGIESDTCMFWGGPFCNKQNASVWAGPKIKFDNLYSYNFYNLNNDSLFFNFYTGINGPALFYEDSTQRFSILFEAADTLTLLDQLDSALYFKIIHSDLQGNPINSLLNGQHIIISKEFGLARFFVIDSFPTVLKPISLIGNVSPTAGFYQLTNEMVYDYQAGDEVQYKESSYYEPPAPPWDYYTRYRKFIFLEREQTGDSLIYHIQQELFYADSVGIVIDTIIKKYLRAEVIAQIPFDKFDGSTRRLSISDYCGQSRWTYSIEPIEDTEFCEADTCWGVSDLGRPPDDLYTSYVMGLGLYSDIAYNPYPGFGYRIQKSIIYFKEEGVECGNEVIVGITEFDNPQVNLIITPNPANTTAKISSPIEMQQFTLRNSYGNTLMLKTVSGREITIDVSGLSDGIYFIGALLDNGKSVTTKLLIVKK